MNRYQGVFDNETKEWNGWGLSQAFSCERKLCLKDSSQYEGTPIDPNTDRMFKLGDAAETLMRVRHPEMQLTMSQFKVTVEGRNGKLDGMIVDKGWKQALVWEHKSMGSRAWSRYIKDMKEGRGLKASKPQYYGQVQLYLFAIRAMGVYFYDKPISQCLFTVIERDHGTINEQIINFDPHVAVNIIERIVKVNKARENNVILAKPTYVQQWECSYCNYKTVCNSIPGGGKEYKNVRP